jgi:hypothetical protein
VGVEGFGVVPVFSIIHNDIVFFHSLFSFQLFRGKGLFKGKP